MEIHLKGLCACRLLKRRRVPRTWGVKEGELARENYTLTMFRGLCTFGRSLCDTLNDTCFFYLRFVLVEIYTLCILDKRASSCGFAEEELLNETLIDGHKIK